MHEGDGYEELRPAISICLLDRLMFQQKSESARWHHSFRLRCDQNADLILTNDLEFHVFELPKFRPSGDNIGDLPADEKWLYLFTHAAETDPQTLASLLRDPAYREAIGVLQMISKSPEDLKFYEDRLKFLRDEKGKLLAAREEGREEGRAEGEQIGLAKGTLTGKVQILQELLGDTPMTTNEFKSLSVDALTTQLAQLQQRLRDRQA
jgi:predicted transposase/invertase (TIGR01784 family)